MIPTQIADQVELLIADMNGIPRGKVVSGSSLLKQGSEKQGLPHLALAHFFQTLTGSYAAIFKDSNPRDEDMLLSPQWQTYRVTPWKGKNVGQVICAAMDKSASPVAFDPRNALQQLLDQYASLDLFPVIAPEAEFYLVKPLADASQPIQAASGSANRVETGAEAFSVDALDKYQDFIQLLEQTCLAANIPLQGLVHEMGPGQIEINVGHGDALKQADDLFLLKRAVKACASRSGYTATFMVKPLADEAGNGLHLHTSVLNGNGQNVFALEDGKAGKVLLQYIAGLQKYLPQAFALFAPTVNSYKRFVPGLSAPINLEWGYDNRTTGFRVPFDSDENGRVENRIAGADANPYLFILASLACGLLGIKEQLTARPAVEGDAYNLPAVLPQDLNTALKALRGCQPMVDLLGKELVDAFISVKTSELQHHGAEISAWERRYLCEAL